MGAAISCRGPLRGDTSATVLTAVPEEEATRASVPCHGQGGKQLPPHPRSSSTFQEGPFGRLSSQWLSPAFKVHALTR